MTGDSCCAGSKCGVSGLGGNEKESNYSRYPQEAEEWSVQSWCKPLPPASPQFDISQRQEINDGYTREQPFTYTGEYLAACDFPLGGFGAGNVLLHGDGTLQGFSIINQVRDPKLPKHCIPACYFGISSGVIGSNDSKSFVLASPETYTEANCGLPRGCPARVSPSSVRRMQKIPGIQGVSLTGRYPIAKLDYTIANFPLSVSLEAMTSVIPGDTKNSSLPAAYFTFELSNPSKEAIPVRLMHAQQNIIGWDGHQDCTSPPPISGWGGNVNSTFCFGENENDKWGGLEFSNPNIAGNDYRNGTMCVAALPGVAKISVIPAASDEETLWANFVSGKETRLLPEPYSSPPSTEGKADCGAVVQAVVVPPGGTIKTTFTLSWHFPNRRRDKSCGKGYDQILPSLLGNYYSNWFNDAKAVSMYVTKNREYLCRTTHLYTDTIFETTIPPDLLDSAAGRVAVMNSPTMWRNSDGTVLGTEGNGCCPLNCTHVYGYTMLMERLWPDLAFNMRHSDFVRNFAKEGAGCTMRFGRGGWAIDGALACIIKTYIVVRQSDSSLAFLSTVWPNVKKELLYIRGKFDTKGDGVLRGQQQNTYDTAMQGANTFIGSYYVCALKATAEMAKLMNEPDLADDCHARAALAVKSYEKICWKEEFGYYIADVNESTSKHSYGPGCFVDQLCGTGLASACGFGHVFDPSHEAKARTSILKYNAVHKPPFTDFNKYLNNGDTGIRVCTYPNGKLGDGMQYDTLVSTGFTSPNIAGCLLDRNLAGAEAFAGYIRQRHDGRNYSPWNEPECNDIYSRAMAHWNIFDQACGHSYDSTKASLQFDPRYNVTNFRCFVSLEGGWGSYQQHSSGSCLSNGTIMLACLWGHFEIASLHVQSDATVVSASLNGSSIKSTISNGNIYFTPPARVQAGQILKVELSGSSVYVSVDEENKTNLRKRSYCCNVKDKEVKSIKQRNKEFKGKKPGNKESRTTIEQKITLSTFELVLLVFLVFALGSIAASFLQQRMIE